MNIGAGFQGQTEKEKRQFISIALDKAIIAMYPQLKDVRFTLWFVPKDERKSEKSPQFTLVMTEAFKFDDKKPKEENLIKDEDIPF